MRIWRSIASVLVLLAVCCLAAAVWSHQTQPTYTGPSAFTSDPDGQLWLGVNDEIWRLEPTGQRSQQFTPEQHALPQPPTQLAWVAFQTLPEGIHSRSSGALLASTPASARLHWLDTATGQPIGTLTLQWPHTLPAPGAGDAPPFAYDPQHKTVAAATASYSAIALFDAQTGAFKAQTPDTLALDAHGLFWTERGFWVTDSKHSAMLRLHPATLQPLERIALQLPASAQNHVYMLRHARPMAPAALAQWPKSTEAGKTSLLPFAVVAQVEPGSGTSRIYAVWPDGQTRPYAVQPGQQLAARALSWSNAQLLAVDGTSGQLQSWPQGIATQAAQPWGDASLQRQLQSLQWLDWARTWLVKVGLGLSGALFLLSLLIFRFTSGPRLAKSSAKTDAARLAAMGKWAKPYKSPRNKLRIIFSTGWPLALGYALMFATVGAGLRWHEAIPLQPIVIQALVTVLALAFAIGGTMLSTTRQRSTNRTSETEPFFNRQALRLLHDPNLFWPHYQPGEKVRETFLLTRMQRLLPKTTWVVVTDRRVVTFRLGLWGSKKSLRLKAQWDHREVRRVAIRRRVRYTLKHLFLGGGLGRYEWAAQHQNGSVISGMPSAPLPAKRGAKLIQVSRRLARNQSRRGEPAATEKTMPTAPAPLPALPESTPFPLPTPLPPETFWQPTATRPNGRITSPPPHHGGAAPAFGA